MILVLIEWGGIKHTPNQKSTWCAIQHYSQAATPNKVPSDLVCDLYTVWLINMATVGVVTVLDITQTWLSFQL